MNELLGRLRGLARNKPVFNGVVAASIAVIVGLLAMFAIGNISFLTSADRFVQDWEIATRSPVEPQDSNILILAVDDDPVFGQTLVTLFRVVRHDEVDRSYRSIAHLLYRHRIERNGRTL